jgi:hypothetical protein
MITTTEDSFDVDYDIFSFAGRVALIGGGIVALDSSIKEGHFDNLKVNKNALKRNNEVIQTVKRAISQDLELPKQKQKSSYAFKDTDQFMFTEEMIKKERANKRIVTGIDTEIEMKDGSRKKVKDLFDGGHLGRSKDLPDELKRAQERIAAYDGKEKVPLILTFDDNDKLQMVSMKSNSGVYDISVVDKNSEISKGGSRIATRGAFRKSNEGFEPTKPVGADVSLTSFIADEYGVRVGGKDGMSIAEINSNFSEFTRNLDRDYGQIEIGRVNPMTVKETIASSKLDPFRKINAESEKQVMNKAFEKGFTTGLGPEDLSKNILYIEGSPYSKPFGEDGHNPKQDNRANTKYRRLDGTEVYNEDLRVLYANEEMMTALKEELAKKGISIGELGKEERIINADLMGTVVDNSRSIEISNRKMSEAGYYLMNDLAKSANLSLEDFTEKLREGKGFDAFTEDQQKRMKRVRLDGFQESLKQEKRLINSKKQAMLVANRTDLNELIARREKLADIKNVMAGRLRGITYVGEEFYLENPEVARRLDFLYSRYKAHSPKELKDFLGKVNEELKSVGKLIPQRILESESYKEALDLKKQGKLTSAIDEVETQLIKIRSTLKDSNLIGLSANRGDEFRLKKKHKDLFVENLKLNKSSIAIGLRRESPIEIGSKIHDSSGQEKVTTKISVPDLGDIVVSSAEKVKKSPLSEDEKIFYRGIHSIGTDKSLKTEPELRNLSSVFLSIESYAKESGNSELHQFMQDYRAASETMTDEDNMEFWKELKKRGVSFADLQGVTTEAGYVRTSVGLAFGASNIDMGFGGPGFFSERHLRLFAGMGAGSYAEELIERRINKGAGRAHEDFKKVQELMSDSTRAGFIDFEDLSNEDLNKGDFFENIFNTNGESDLDVLEMRRKYLAKYKNDFGAVFFDLGEEIDGVSRIPIFTEETYKGYAGEQIGYKGDVRRFAPVENLTKQIALEVRKGKDKDKGRLNTLIKNYKVAISQMENNLKKAKYSGKFTESGYLVFKSATDDVKEYSEMMRKKSGAKNYINPVAQISDKKFTEMFGKAALDEYYKSGKKVSKAFGMILREPADAAAAMAMNYIPGGEADDALYLTEETLAMIGGDLDQDAGSAGAALRKLSIEQIEELAYGNSENSIRYRENMQRRGKISLKGRGAKSIFDFSFEDQRRASFLGKVLEKGAVGKVSNAMSAVQQMNQRLNAISNPEKYHKTTLLVGLLVENTIKGKKQSMEELLSKDAYQMIDAIMGKNDFNGKSIEERSLTLKNFMDKLMLNNGSEFGDRIRSGENSKEFVEEIARKIGGDAIDQSHYDEAKRMVDDIDFKDLTSEDTLGSIFEYSDGAKEYETIMDDAEQLITEQFEGTSEADILRKARAEEAQEALKNTKKAMGKVGKNLAAYSIIPAAAFGILGTVFGASSSISSDVEFSENKNQHDKSGFKPFKPMDSINTNSPRHVRPEVRGSAQSGFQINKYAESHRTSEMRTTDDTQNFDYHDMQDRMKKGY